MLTFFRNVATESRSYRRKYTHTYSGHVKLNDPNRRGKRLVIRFFFLLYYPNQFWGVPPQIKDTDNQTLITELVLRGYNLSRLREDEPTTEIVKIG